MLDPLLGSEQTGDTAFLILPEPGLAGFGEGSAAEIIDQLADDDQHKGDGVHPVDLVAKDLDANAHAPEVHSQHGDVEERRRREPEEQRGQTVEEG